MLRTLHHWQRTRNFRQLLAGSPALLLLGLSFGFFIYQYFRDEDIRSRLAVRYSNAAFDALNRDEHQTAVTYFDRLFSLRSEDPQALYGLALSLENSNDPFRFEAVAEKVAPLTHAVYQPAHLWRAQRILEKPLTPELARAAEIHLSYAVELEPDDARAHVLLGRLYFLAGRHKSAIEHFQLAVKTFPDDLLELAKSHSAVKQQEEASRTGTQALEHFKKQLTQNPLDLFARLKLAESLLFFEKFDESLAILHQGLAIQDSPKLKQAIARVHLIQADLLADAGNTAEQLAHIQSAIQADPSEMASFQQVMGIFHKNDENAEQLRSFLSSTLSEGKATALIHLLLGTDAGMRDDTETAVKHLEISFQADPKMAVAANNLAWVFAHQEQGNYQRALALIDAALVLEPNSVSFHHTRGVILVRMGKWREGVVELEKVLTVKGDADARKALATAYEQLGLAELANEQRRLLQEMESE